MAAAATKESLTVRRIKTAVTLRAPFYGPLMLGLEWVPDPTVKTAEVDGVTCRYNPHYVEEELDFEEAQGLFAHEAHHCGANHHTRIGDRDDKLFNIAADFSTNPEILAAGFTLPPRFLLEERFRGMSVERIYNIIDRERQSGGGDQPGQGGSQPGQQTGNDPNGGQNQENQPQTTDQQSGHASGHPDVGGCGSVIAPKDSATGQPLIGGDLSRHRVQWNANLFMAEMTAKKVGDCPGAAETILNEMQDGRADWKDAMRRFLRRCVDQSYSWLRQDRRFIHAGIYMPSRESKRLGEIVVAVDTSASVTDRQLQIIQNEIIQMFSEVNPLRVHIVFCDTMVQKTEEFERSEYQDISLSFPGRGGTRVRPVFDWIEQQDFDPVCVVYFTDLEVGDFGEEPNEYPVLWGALDDKPAPWGEIVRLDEI